MRNVEAWRFENPEHVGKDLPSIAQPKYGVERIGEVNIICQYRADVAETRRIEILEPFDVSI